MARFFFYSFLISGISAIQIVYGQSADRLIPIPYLRAQMPSVKLHGKYSLPTPPVICAVHPSFLRQQISVIDKEEIKQYKGLSRAQADYILFEHLLRNNFLNDALTIYPKIITNNEAPFHVAVFAETALLQYHLHRRNDYLTAVSNGRRVIQEYRLKTKWPYKYCEIVYTMMHYHLATNNIREAEKCIKLITEADAEHYRKKTNSVDQNFFSISAQYAAGAWYFKNKLYDDAIRHFLSALRDGNKFNDHITDDITYWLGRSYELKSNLKYATAVYISLLAEYPLSDFRFLVLYNLSKIRYAENKYRDAWENYFDLYIQWDHAGVFLKEMCGMNLDPAAPLTDAFKYLSTVLYGNAQQIHQNALFRSVGMTNRIRLVRDSEYFSDEYAAEFRHFLGLALDGSLSISPFDVPRIPGVSYTQAQLFKDLSEANEEYINDFILSGKEDEDFIPETEEEYDEELDILMPKSPPSRPIIPGSFLSKRKTDDEYSQFQRFLSVFDASVRLHPFKYFDTVAYRNISTYAVLQSMGDFILFEMASLAQQMGYPSQAAGLFSRLLSEYPKSALTLHAGFAAGSCLYQESNYSAAYETWTALDSQDSDEIQFWIAHALYALSNYTAAEEKFTAIKENTPSPFMRDYSHYQTGWIQLKTENYEAAQNIFNRIFESVTNTALRYAAGISIGDCYNARKSPVHALLWYKSTVALIPETFSDQAIRAVLYSGFDNIAATYSLVKSNQAGIQYFEQSLKRHKGDLEAELYINYKIADLYQAAQNYLYQIETYQKMKTMLKSKDSRNISLLTACAEAWVKAGNPKNAVSEYKKILRITKAQSEKKKVLLRIDELSAKPKKKKIEKPYVEFKI